MIYDIDALFFQIQTSYFYVVHLIYLCNIGVAPGPVHLEIPPGDWTFICDDIISTEIKNVLLRSEHLYLCVLGFIRGMPPSA